MIRKEFRSRSTPREINQLTKSAADFLAGWIEDQDLVYDLRLVLSEACTNVILHSYRGKQDGELEVHVHIEPQKKVCINVLDTGHPFYGPTRAICHSSPQDECGRGLYIISQLVDSFTFEHRQGQNVLSLERDIEEHIWKG